MSTEENKSVSYTRLVGDDEVDVDDEAEVDETSSLVDYSTGSGDSSKNKKDNTNNGGASYSEAVEASGFGKFHALLLIVCGWANMSDAVEILSVSFLLPDASEDMNINSVEKGLLTSIIFVGMLVGGYLWGSLADIRGRRQILIYSLSCNAFFGATSSVCQNFWLFLAMRFLSGVGVGGSIPVIFSYFGEFQPNNHRGKMISALSTFWMAGNILTAGLAWAIIPREHLGYHNPDGFSYESWRIFVAVCCIPSASSVLTFLLMPESPKYLLEKGDKEKALAIMKKIYTFNNKGAKASDYPIDHLIPSSREEKSLLTNDRRWKCLQQFGDLSEATIQLFKQPLTRITITMLTIVFTLSFGYYGMFMWFPELLKRVDSGGSACSYFNESALTNSSVPSDQIYVDVFYISLSNLPGNLLTIFLMDKLSRKFLITSSMVISGISVFFIWSLETRTQVLIMSCVFGAISVITWNTLNVINVELYPTSCRSTSFGVMAMMNRMGAILGSLLFGVLIDFHCAIPLILIAVLFGIGGLSALTLPNTTNIELS